MKTAVIYARVSTHRQAEEEVSITSQIDRCQAKADELGATVSRVFKDEGISGRTTRRRAFQDLLTFCKLNNPDYLICWSTSRFSRDRIDAALYKRSLKRDGTEVVFASVQIDRDTSSGMLTEAMLELFDEHQSRQISADTSRSMINNARNGYYNGGNTPFGFQAVPSEKDPRRKCLVPKLGEAQLAKRIFDLRLEGVGSQSICDRLNASGALYRGRPWSRNLVLSVLNSYAVVGKIVFNRKNRKEGILRDPEDWVVVDSHEPIIERFVWDEVRTIMKSEPCMNSSHKSSFAFTGILKCGECGASFQIETAKGRSARYCYYNCRNHQKKRSCPSRRIRSNEFDSWLIDTILDEVLTPQSLMDSIRDMRLKSFEWENTQKLKKLSLKKELADVKRRQKNLYEVLEEFGMHTPNLGDLTLRLRELKANREGVERQLEEIDNALPPKIDITDSDVAEVAEFVRRTVTTMDNPKKLRHFFSAFVEKIVIGGDQVEIYYHPAALIGGAHGTSVHSRQEWLPSADSNHGQAD